MGRFEQIWESIRRAYEASREAVRAARERAERNGNGEQLRRVLIPPEPVPQWAGQPPPEEPPTGQAPTAQAPTTQAPAGQAPTGQAPAGQAPAGLATLPGLVQPPPPPGPGPVEDAVPRSLRIAAAWSWRLIVVALVAWGLLWITNQFLLLVAPLMIGLLLAGLLMPAQRALQKLRVNRSLSALLVVVAGLAAVGGTLYLVITAFVAGVPEIVDEVESGIGEFEDWLQNGPFGLTDEDLEGMISQAEQWLNDNAQDLTEVGVAAVTGTVQFLTGMILTLVITFFFLRDGGRIWRFLVGLLPVAARAPMAYAGDGGWRALSGYVRATLMVALVDAVGIALGLWILDQTLGMPFVLPLAALVFLGAFVPIVGAFVSGTVAVVVALISPPGTEGFIKALIVLGIVILVQQVEGNVLQPFIVSKMVRIHPLAVIIAVTAGILLAGIIGALVAVPVVAVVNAVVRRLHDYHRAPSDPEPALALPGPSG